jgi:hypothetical protein
MAIRVDPNSMDQLATVDLVREADLLGTSVSNIADVWAGPTGWQRRAEEADFSRRFNAAVTGLFGSQQQPDAGALQKIYRAVAMAAANYASTEQTVVRMFNTMFGGGGGPVPPKRHDDVGPITENN